MASAAKSLRHRGPDSKGLKEFEIFKTEALNHIGLVHTRLSIIDLSRFSSCLAYANFSKVD